MPDRNPHEGRKLKHQPEKTLPVILDSRWRDPGDMFKIQELDLEFSNGERRTYQRMKTHGLGAVIIVPMKDDETVLLAREYAAGLHHYEIGLPKGRREKGESVLQAAQREMKEEIGFGANELIDLASLSLAPGYMTHVTHIVLARDLYPEKLEGDEPEDLVDDASETSRKEVEAECAWMIRRNAPTPERPYHSPPPNRLVIQCGRG